MSNQTRSRKNKNINVRNECSNEHQESGIIKITHKSVDKQKTDILTKFLKVYN